MNANIVDRWPPRRHVVALLVMYLSVGATFGLAFLLVVAALTHPVGVTIFLGGVLTGCLCFAAGRRALRGTRLRQPWRHRPA